MGLRSNKPFFAVQHVLRGRTLRHIIDGGTTIKVNCNGCWRSTTWSPAQVRQEVKFQAFLDKPIEDIAEKMGCGVCKSRDFFVTIETARNPTV